MVVASPRGGSHDGGTRAVGLIKLAEGTAVEHGERPYTQGRDRSNTHAQPVLLLVSPEDDSIHQTVYSYVSHQGVARLSLAVSGGGDLLMGTSFSSTSFLHKSHRAQSNEGLTCLRPAKMLASPGCWPEMRVFSFCPDCGIWGSLVRSGADLWMVRRPRRPARRASQGIERCPSGFIKQQLCKQPTIMVLLQPNPKEALLIW